MICPLPRANEMSALQARWDRAMSNKEGAHALSRGRRGAGHETTGGHLPSLGGDADVVAGRRYFGNRPPQPATLAGALSGRRGPRAVWSPPVALAAQGAHRRGPARPAPLPRALPGLERPPLLPLRPPRPRAAAVVQLR